MVVTRMVTPSLPIRASADRLFCSPTPRGIPLRFRIAVGVANLGGLLDANWLVPQFQPILHRSRIRRT
jgi:hypothetical protein